MNGRELASLLAKTPPTRLDILRIAHENTLPNGSLDIETLLTLTPDIEAAQQQARLHAKAVQRLRESINCHSNSHRY